MPFLRLPLFLMLIMTFAIACGDATEEDVNVEPTLASIQKNIFTKSCASSSCHGSSLQGNLDLRSGAAFKNLVGVEPKNAAAKAAGLKRVVAGDTGSSFLIHKITSPGSGEESRMPLGGDALSTAKIKAIRTWIENGAKE
jgi:mono/diheme cytochrome c family protein